VQGPAGPPGQPGIGTPGRDGRDGAPGAPGLIAPFPAPPIFFLPPNVPPPEQGEASKVIRYLTGLPNYEGKLPETYIPIPIKTYSFDPATCALTESETLVTVTIPEQTITITSDGSETYGSENVLVRS
jgi:hypothetical protein